MIFSARTVATPTIEPRTETIEQQADVRAGFPARARVRTKAEFDLVFARGRRCAHPLLVLHVLDTPPATARLGLAVSRKVDSHATGRNRIKRVLREQFRLHRALLRPGAYVVVARHAARAADHPSLRAALTSLLQRAGALPLSAPTGTMPPPDPRVG